MTSPPTPQKPATATTAQHEGLPIGTRFGELEILRVIGVGGFGIVYLAFDHSLEREVALKEYMPASLASRGEGAQVTVRSGALAETYAIGLRSFVNEARLLARFDHPSLVKVYRFWEDNATAYMVMPYLQGRTVRDARRLLSQSPDEAWIRGVVDPMLGALGVLHREEVFHRDIAPDNILLPPQGPPVLLDFGAARHVINDRTQTLTAIFKPSYAPIEQYGEMTSLRQGAWTDLYALGAVVHFLLRGVPPAPATARAIHDVVVPLANESFPGVSQQFLKAIDWALSVRPNERPQSAEELRSAIEGRTPIPTPVVHDTNLDGSRASAVPPAAAPVVPPATAVSTPKPSPPAPPAPPRTQLPVATPALPPVAPLAPPSPPLTLGPLSRSGPSSTSMSWIDEADEVTVPPRNGMAAPGKDKAFDPDDTVVMTQEARDKLLATMQSAATVPRVTSAQETRAGAATTGRTSTARTASSSPTSSPTTSRTSTTGGKSGANAAPSMADESSQKAMPGWMLAVGGVVIAAVLGGGAYWKFSGPAAAPSDVPTSAAQPMPAAPTPAPAPAPTPAPAAQQSGAAVVVDVAPSAAPASVAQPAAEPSPPVAVTPTPVSPPAAPPVAAAVPTTTSNEAPEASAAAKREAAKAEAAKAAAAKAELAKAKAEAEAAKLAAAKTKAAKAASKPGDGNPANVYARPKDDPAGTRPKPSTAASAVAVAPVRPAEPPPPSGPATAREACGDRVFISLALCMQRECERPRFRDNAECVKLAEDIRRRREQ